jgi:hypothetical protein
MSDMAELFNGWREHKQAKRANNTAQSTQALIDAGIPFEAHNAGTHIVIRVGNAVYDFWPSTGLWWLRATKIKHRGVFRLIQAIAALKERLK